MENYKILLLGDSNSGKTSILTRFIDDKFDSNLCGGTIGVDFKSKNIKKKGSNDVKLQIWDTAGQERFRAVTKSYYKQVTCALIVFDLSNGEIQKEKLEFWIKELLEYSEDAIIIIVGNKTDLVRKHNDAQQQWQHSVNINSLKRNYNNIEDYLETSAKTGKGIKYLFNKLVELIEKDKTLIDVTIDTPQMRPIEINKPLIESSKCC